MARTESNAADFVLAKNKSGGASPSPRLRGEGRGEGYKDIPGFCKSATTADLFPGRGAVKSADKPPARR